MNAAAQQDAGSVRHVTLEQLRKRIEQCARRQDESVQVIAMALKSGRDWRQAPVADYLADYAAASVERDCAVRVLAVLESGQTR